MQSFSDAALKEKFTDHENKGIMQMHPPYLWTCVGGMSKMGHLSLIYFVNLKATHETKQAERAESTVNGVSIGSKRRSGAVSHRAHGVELKWLPFSPRTVPAAHLCAVREAEAVLVLMVSEACI